LENNSQRSRNLYPLAVWIPRADIAIWASSQAGDKMTAEKVGLRLRRLFWLLATACMIKNRRDMLKPVAHKRLGQDQSVSIRRA
jgi:hypothetical protein